jgi:NDP-sugar pyrophosphorylase family protein
MMTRNPSLPGYYKSARMPTGDDVDVLVLAGGKGSRLRAGLAPELRVTPKLLVPVIANGRDEPMIDHTLRGLLDNGLSNVSLLTSNDAEASGESIEAHAIRKFSGLGNFKLFREQKELGTAGAVYAALSYISAPLAVITPGDTLFPWPKLVSGIIRHFYGQADITWCVTTDPGPTAQNRGRLLIDRFSELLVHSAEDSDSLLVPIDRRHRLATSAGVVLLNNEAFRTVFERYVATLDVGQPVDLHRQVIPWALVHEVAVRVFDIEQPAPDLGTPDRLFKFGRSQSPEAQIISA